ncbi:hypothetical protein AB0G04_28905 [Actinoplanes sp. NPDC023801]|uniref:hypothetical protein n=1 Tax=Actinoplanes sp. NPDC023801 TaxID=3154595 RepID=UPI0033FD6321
MIRGYAIGMGAGTQFFTQAPWLAAVGEFTPVSRTVTMTLAWPINALAAEWIIRRARTRRRPAVAGTESRPAERPLTYGAARRPES